MPVERGAATTRSHPDHSRACRNVRPRGPSVSGTLVAHPLHPVQFLPPIVPVRAMCVMAVAGVAPCQCLTPGGHQTTSPARIHDRSPLLGPAHAGGDDQGWPGCVCQWRRPAERHKARQGRVPGKQRTGAGSTGRPGEGDRHGNGTPPRAQRHAQSEQHAASDATHHTPNKKKQHLHLTWDVSRRHPSRRAVPRRRWANPHRTRAGSTPRRLAPASGRYPSPG